ncbi:MAG: hypothetical protein ACO3YX_03580 [Candidatus Nanopelagicaceae bacterium]|jgi:hypothetical protein
MAVSVYDINTYVKNHSSVSNVAGKVMSFFPIVATGSPEPPYVVYYYRPDIKNVEAYWQRCDLVRYSVFDSDIDRMYQISEKIIDLLGSGDQIAQPGGVAGSNVRIQSSYMVSSSEAPALEKDGIFRINLDFKIMSVSR